VVEDSAALRRGGVRPHPGLPVGGSRCATITDISSDEPLGESRWPPAAALVVYIAFTIAVRLWLPGESAVRLPWLVPSLEAALLVALVAGDPARLARRTPWVRRIALTIVVVLVAAALWATALLVYDLIKGHGVSRSPTKLLASGALVWAGNNLAFGMLYWLMDSGGPIARSRNRIPVDFAFVQQMSPELAPPGWRPVFLDYLHLGFTNATAFSPTDVMPLTLRAKYVMVVQSTVALALFGLVVARAVNAFT
jgi:hypothetical protein